jgi:aerobic-type carbon monoxide dehydrogenase small subunit (CoxS/CutS family)
LRREYAPETDEVRFEVDGQEVLGHAGESLAAAMLAEGFDSNRSTPWRHQPRSAFCGMGACFECIVHLEGVGTVRSCMTACVDGAAVRRPGNEERNEA